MANEEWGPLAALIGDWEGTAGMDVAYSHERGEVWETPFSEKVTMKPFGPVQNGRQTLFGLDYKTAMWRGDETNPFHTELGYWLWDAATGEVLRCFVVPRGIALVAGGTTSADATSFAMTAGESVAPYRIAENTYLAANASTVRYESNITVHADGSWSYDEVTTLRMAEIDGEFAHTDRNTLVRVAPAETAEVASLEM
jgi:hypothetical protein